LPTDTNTNTSTTGTTTGTTDGSTNSTSSTGTHYFTLEIKFNKFVGSISQIIAKIEGIIVFTPIGAGLTAFSTLLFVIAGFTLLICAFCRKTNIAAVSS
jgi:hypothetical protein